jgi:hypothetical protein
MRTRSPSGRLVLAALAVAVVVLLIASNARPRATELAGSATPSTTASLIAGGASGSPEIPTDQATSPATSPTMRAIACQPTDQDRYVYVPDRLAVQAACIRVSGTVEAVRVEADGDLHILLALDPAFVHLLTPANQGEELGDLVVEPVCVKPVTQADAIAICSSDPDPMRGPFPAVGVRIWMEGRYVFDLEHGGWAELHPLYRWGYR